MTIFFINYIKSHSCFLNFKVIFLTFILSTVHGFSQIGGTWNPLSNLAPSQSGGVMLLLTDGSVLVKGYMTTGDCDNTWYKLTPDLHGSYINGTWTMAASMNDSRLYCSTRLLRNGNLYIAGGEYGTGKASAEIYNPDTDLWNYTTGILNVGDSISDANSEILPDGKILQALVSSTTYGYKGTVIFDPKTKLFTYGPPTISMHDEASWLKLPDNSILFVGMGSYLSERYIPSLNNWISDNNAPVMLYDYFGFEAGASFLLPDGRGFFLGSTSKTAFYTPSGSTIKGTWAIGPNIPNNLGAVDAAAAMMSNGNILCAFSPTPSANVVDSIFKTPTYFYEFNYLTNAFVPVLSPNGTSSVNISCYTTNMLDLPDGNVLYAAQGDNQFYVYTPSGTPVVIGKPTINSFIKKGCDTLMLTGTLFNGISEGACYGDDWQMATNYPLVRLTDGINVFYAKTFNWNSDGVQRGSAIDTTYCSIPSYMPPGSYSLVVVANGISSTPVNFISCTVDIANYEKTIQQLKVLPNPSSENAFVQFYATENKNYILSIVDIVGHEVLYEKGCSIIGNNKHPLDINHLAKGIYQIKIIQNSTIYSTKLVVD